jgi:hypothetical protein
VNGIVYGINAGLVEAINPQNGQVYWSKDENFGASNSPQILSLGDDLILPIGKIVLSRTNGNILWKFPDYVLAAAVYS